MRRENRFDRTMLAAIFTLAWPTMLEQLTQTAVQYIDTAMVGSLGTAATAASACGPCTGRIIARKTQSFPSTAIIPCGREEL